MEQINIDFQILGFVFNRLRAQEGVELGTVTSMLDSKAIFKILFNSNYKKDMGIELTELETSVWNEVGSYIRMFVRQKYEEAKASLNFDKLPFENMSNKTSKDYVVKRQIRLV